MVGRGVAVGIDVGVAVGAGVGVDVDAAVGVGVNDGVNNYPGPQVDKTKLKTIKGIITA